VTEFSHSQGAPIAIQRAHAGRKASMKSTADGRGPVLPGEGGWETVGPSVLAFGRLPEPRALTIDEIHAVVDDFVRAAERAVGAGFDAIEIHGAHGYLFHQFLSPLSNTREDEYGGSF
jgi:2,4-dienoyl-CoA reductase-like NADH-dependent reductase (Old Yellow Enzyme family)